MTPTPSPTAPIRRAPRAPEASARPITGLVASVALLTASLGAIAAVGRANPLLRRSPVDWPDAVAQHGPASASLSLLWLLLGSVVLYQLAISVLALVARGTAPRRWSAISARLPRGLVARVSRRAIGIGISASVLTMLGPTLAGAEPGPAPAEAGGEADGSAPGSDAAPRPTGPLTAGPTPTGPTTGAPLLMVPLDLRAPADAPASRTGDPTASDELTGAAVMTALEDAGPASTSSGNHGESNAAATSLGDPIDQPTTDGADAADEPSGSTPANPVAPAPGTASATEDGLDPDPGAPEAAGTSEAATDPGGPTTTTGRDDPSPALTASDTTSTVDHVGDDEWRIEPGDHLWAVAAETLRDEWGRPPTDREVLGYWQTLLDANHERLVDPTNPDLVFPGQVLVLPPVPTLAA